MNNEMINNTHEVRKFTYKKLDLLAEGKRILAEQGTTLEDRILKKQEAFKLGTEYRGFVEENYAKTHAKLVENLKKPNNPFKENTLEDIFNCLRLDEINEMICDYELAEKYENGLNKLVINFKNDYPSI
jgi:ubiquinone/menaquinone biosynthesis C-methylase UbiE